MKTLCKLISLYLALSTFQARALTLKRPQPSKIYTQRDEGIARIRFNWQTKIKNTVYLEFSLDKQFERVLISRKVDSLPYIWQTDVTGHVWWRVSIFDDNKNLLERSEVRRFTITPPPPSVEITDIGGYFFEWDSIQKAEYFRFKIAKNKDFEPALIKEDLKEKTYSLSDLKPGTYYWKVGAKYNRQIPIVYSAFRKLVVNKDLTSLAMTSVAKPSYKKLNLDAPENLTSSKTTYRTASDYANVNLKWRKVKKATSYQLSVGSRTDVISLKNQTNLRLRPGTYNWKVRASSSWW